MAKFELKLPKMGESVAEATLTSWLKEVGDTIEEDEAVLEIATDKVDSEVPSEVEGTIIEILFDVDAVVKVGDTIAVIETLGDEVTSSTLVTNEVEAVPEVEILEERFNSVDKNEDILNIYILEHGSWLNADQVGKKERNATFPKSGFTIDNRNLLDALVFENLKNGKKPKVFLRDDVLRTLIFTPDASRGMALLANTPDAYGHTWHLPCDDDRLTCKQFIAEISSQLGREVNHEILSPFKLKIASLFHTMIKETKELFPRYQIDNIFDSSKFKTRFPDFKVTTYQEGIREIISDYNIK